MNLLLSIKPEYSEKILSGQKKFEFRKQKPRRSIDQVFIYESSPSKAIVGWFCIRKIHSGSPEEIWNRFKDYGGIEEEKYLEYCNNSKIVYAFEIDKTVKLDNPINPFDLNSDFKPPQSFSYIEDSEIASHLGNQQIDINYFQNKSLLDF